MKKASHILILLLFVMLSPNLFSQELKYRDLSSGDRPKGEFKSYVIKAGNVYKIGDSLEIESLDYEIASLGREIESLGCEIASLGREIESLGCEIASQSSEISSLSTDIAARTTEIINKSHDIINC